jgi:hypothetical protein
MAWNILEVKWEPAASPGGVGWVYVATPHKLAIAVQKLAVMSCTGAPLLRKFAALRALKTAQVTSQKSP